MSIIDILLTASTLILCAMLWLEVCIGYAATKRDEHDSDRLTGGKDEMDWR